MTEHQLLHNTSSVEISHMRVGMPRVCTLVLFIYCCFVFHAIIFILFASLSTLSAYVTELCTF